MHRIGWLLVSATVIGCSGATPSRGSGGDSCSSNGECASNVCKGAATSSSSGATHGEGVAPSTEAAPELAPLGTCSAPDTSAPVSSSSGGGCEGHGEGDYRCAGAYGIEVCHGGVWQHEGTCSCSVSVGDPRKPPYPTSCGPLSTGSVSCEYAGKACLVCSKGRSCAPLQ